METKARPEIVIDQLTPFQFRILRRLAAGTDKIYGACTGVEGDTKPEEMNAWFNETLKLIEWGLVVDASGWPNYAKSIKHYAEHEGRDAVIIALSVRGQAMWGRVPWDKRVN
jgi:hypothetical protein